MLTRMHRISGRRAFIYPVSGRESEIPIRYLVNYTAWCFETRFQKLETSRKCCYGVTVEKFRWLSGNFSGYPTFGHNGYRYRYLLSDVGQAGYGTVFSKITIRCIPSVLLGLGAGSGRSSPCYFAGFTFHSYTNLYVKLILFLSKFCFFRFNSITQYWKCFFKTKT